MRETREVGVYLQDLCAFSQRNTFYDLRGPCCQREMVLMEVKSGKKRILVLDGAGFRSYGTLLILEGIMKAVSLRARKPLSPSDVFDLICGSSGGGLAALLVGRLGLDCSAAIAIYRELASAICGSKEDLFLKSLLNSFDHEPESGEFRKALSKVEKGDLTFNSGDEESQKTSKTFVTVACAAPLYNSTFCIRSYPTAPKAPPPNHAWLARDVAYACVAARTILRPLSLGDTGFSFRDSAFAGFSTPISFVKKEFDSLWPMEDLGPVVSIGVDSKVFWSSEARPDWNTTESALKPYVERILVKISSKQDRVNTDIRSRASFILKQYMGIAVETVLAYADVNSRGLFPSGSLIRLDPPTGLTNVDFVDFFNLALVEKNVGDWLRGEGKAIVDQIATKLVEPGTIALTPEVLKELPPPPPPPDTNPGYNKQLDKPRPRTMADYLQNYHVIFIIDDSGSMKGRRWEETQAALIEIADFAQRNQCRNIDIMFLNNKKVYKEFQGKDLLQSIFQHVPIGSTPTGARLEEVIDEHLQKLDDNRDKPEYGTIRPLDIIVLTDGVPTDEPNVVLQSAVARRKEAKHHPNAIGIQIVQIGNDKQAERALKELMNGNVESMVDTVPYRQELTARELERILLGGLHPNLRAMISP